MPKKFYQETVTQYPTLTRRSDLIAAAAAEARAKELLANGLGGSNQSAGLALGALNQEFGDKLSPEQIAAAMARARNSNRREAAKNPKP